MQIGDKIKFSDYEWRVFDLKNNEAVLITQDIIELRPYHTSAGDITWANCELRNYLNSVFFNSFSEADKAIIVPTTIKNCDNPWFGTIGGDDTMDNIF